MVAQVAIWDVDIPKIRSQLDWYASFVERNDIMNNGCGVNDKKIFCKEATMAKTNRLTKMGVLGEMKELRDTINWVFLLNDSELESEYAKIHPSTVAKIGYPDPKDIRRMLVIRATFHFTNVLGIE